MSTRSRIQTRHRRLAGTFPPELHNRQVAVRKAHKRARVRFGALRQSFQNLSLAITGAGSVFASTGAAFAGLAAANVAGVNAANNLQAATDRVRTLSDEGGQL